MDSLIKGMLRDFILSRVKINFLEKDDWNNNNFDGEIVEVRKFHGFDSEQQYKEIGHPDYGIDDISYEYNKHGYRTSKETNDVFKDNIVAAFGCSNTFGAGLKWEETWPQRLNYYLDEGWSVKNYGVDGGSCDSISRNINNYLLYNNPKVICCFLPDPLRMEVYSDGNLINFNASTPNYMYNKLDYHSYKKIMNSYYQFYSFIKNIKFIELLCKSKNVKLHWFCWSETILKNIDLLKKNMVYDNYCEDVELTNDSLIILPRARDNAHYGKQINDILARGFYNAIIKND